MNTQGVKHYLAYFHQSFKLQPSFKGLYYNEGHITEEMRKNSKYLKKDFAAYDEIFKLLQIRDDRRKDELESGQTDGEEKRLQTRLLLMAAMKKLMQKQHRLIKRIHRQMKQLL